MAEEQEQKIWEFKAEDIFEEVPSDPENILMNIPPEISEKMGWVPGDTLRILIGDLGTIKIEKVEDNEDQDKE